MLGTTLRVVAAVVLLGAGARLLMDGPFGFGLIGVAGMLIGSVSWVRAPEGDLAQASRVALIGLGLALVCLSKEAYLVALALFGFFPGTVPWLSFWMVFLAIKVAQSRRRSAP